MPSLLESYFPNFANCIHRISPRWRISAVWSNDTLDARQRSLLRVLAVARKERLDASVLVGNLADEHRWSYRWRLKRLARRLRQGVSLVDALEQTPDALSDDAVLAIRFATQCGTLDSTFARLIDRHDESVSRMHKELRYSLTYALGIGAFAALILTFQMTFIAPTFKMMYRDLGFASEGSDYPWAFQSLVLASQFVSDYFPLILACLIALLLVVSIGTTRRFLRRVIAGRWVGSVARLRSANLLGMLADSVESGRPLAGSLSTLARYHFDSGIRHKLLLARNEVEQGAEVWDSLAQARLLSQAESDAIAKMPTSPDRVWTLRRLAAWKSDNVNHTRENLLTLVQPAVVLILAAIVLWIGYAYFQFLTNLIENLAKP